MSGAVARLGGVAVVLATETFRDEIAGSEPSAERSAPARPALGTA